MPNLQSSCRMTMLVILVLSCSALPTIAQSNDPAFDQLKSYSFGRDTASLDRIVQMVEQSHGNTKFRAQVAAGLASVLGSAATFDAKQFACRQLVFVAGEPQVPVLADALKDDKLCHYALLALANIPGKAVNDALVNHVSDTAGENRVDLLSLLASRGDSRAEAQLTQLLTNRDNALVSVVLADIEKIKDPARQLTGRLMDGSQDSGLSDALLRRADGFKASGDNNAAFAIYTLIDKRSQIPIVRAAALRGLVQTGTDPAAFILKALTEDGTQRQRMAADLIGNLSEPAMHKVFEYLPKLTAHGQLLVLAAIANRGDFAGSASVMLMCRSTRPDVRLAALKALGNVGDESAVQVLLEAAAEAPSRDIARLSLARLRGKGIDTALMATITAPAEPAARRIEAILAVGSRAESGAVPALIRVASNGNSAICSAALSVLRDIAPPGQLPAIIPITLSQTSDTRDAAVEAATEIARRGENEGQRTGPLVSALDVTRKPEDRLTLLTILDQVGGPIALDAVEKAAGDSSAEIRHGAITMLADWPSEEPMNVLLQIVQANGEPRSKSIALRGYLRMIGSNDQRSPDATLALYRGVSNVNVRADDKRQVLSGIGKLGTLSALEFAQSFVKDDSVKAEAESAVTEIGRSTIGAFPSETKVALQPIAESGTTEAVRKRALDVLALPAKSSDYIIAWEVSPAYQQEGLDYSRLFDIPFPPEIAGKDKQTPWRLMPIVTNPEQPWLLDLLALWGGEQKVAYLRTAIQTESPRSVVLELGSDDGIKGWLNEKVIVADNTQRGVQPGQEKVTVSLKAGWNILLLKVTQNVLGWGACARFANADGSPVNGLKYSVVSAVK